MRCLLIATLLSATAWPQQPARVAGRVLTQSGDPIRRAMVRLFGVGSYTQTSDENGAFAIENVTPGRYTLMAQRTGFSTQKYGASTPLIRDCVTADGVGLDARTTA
jgi:protocatechuate 3,4-dioxygenase beta subunit